MYKIAVGLLLINIISCSTPQETNIPSNNTKANDYCFRNPESLLCKN